MFKKDKFPFDFGLVFVVLLSSINQVSASFSINQLSVNPYKVLDQTITSKEYRNEMKENFERTLLENCNFAKKSTDNLFCEYQNLLSEIFKLDNEIQKLAVENKLLVSNFEFLYSALYAGNFELDFLLSKTAVDEISKSLLVGIQNRDENIQKIYQVTEHFLWLASKEQKSQVHLTILPTFYSVDKSMGRLEALSKFLKVANCGQGQWICGHLLFQMYTDYMGLKLIFNEVLQRPITDVIGVIQKMNPLDLNSLVERRWLAEIDKVYREKNYDFFYDKLAYSSGYLNDEENRYKELYIKYVITNNALIQNNTFIEEKANAWKAQSVIFEGLYGGINIHNDSRVNYRNKTLSEIRDQREGLVEVLNGLDKEVINEKNKNIF